MSLRIAIISWGSLLWDPDSKFDRMHRGWIEDGPVLKIEFSQVDPAADGGLTLVIDSQHGAPCRTYYALSNRQRPETALQDLSRREGVPNKAIGFVSLLTFRSRGHDPASVQKIALWARQHRIDVALWTDCPSNFSRRCHRPFSVSAAIAHLQGLSPQAKVEIAEYVWRAPATVDTPLRRALQGPPWFAPLQPHHDRGSKERTRRTSLGIK
jgi:hypothetical protein